MLKRFFMSLLVAYMVSISSFAVAAEITIVKLVTSEGKNKLELNNKKAPITTDNFIQYVKDGYYQNTIFHRVIPGFIIQGGVLLVICNLNQIFARQSKMKLIMDYVIYVEQLLWHAQQPKDSAN